MNEEDLFAALDRAKAKQAERFEPCVPESCEPILPETRDLFIAYAQFIDTRRLVKLDTAITHICNVHCPRDVIGDYAFCRQSGKLHVCDIKRCTERQTISGEDVCPLTLKKYGAHFGLDLNDRSGSREQFSKVTEKKHTHTKSFGPKPKRKKSKNGIKGRKLSKRTIEKKHDQAQLHTIACNTMSKLLSKCSIPIPTGLVDRFAKISVKLWSKISVNAEKSNRAMAYHFKYHCVVVAYNMQNGFGTSDVPLLCANVFLMENLPNMKQFPAYDIKTAWHTKHTKQFLKSLDTIRESELVELGDSLRPLWPDT